MVILVGWVVLMSEVPLYASCIFHGLGASIFCPLSCGKLQLGGARTPEKPRPLNLNHERSESRNPGLGLHTPLARR